MTYNEFKELASKYAECYIETEILGHSFKGKFSRVFPLITKACNKLFTYEDTPKDAEYLKSCSIIKCWEECAPAHVKIILDKECRFYPKEEHPEFDDERSYRMSKEDPRLYYCINVRRYNNAKDKKSYVDYYDNKRKDWKNTHTSLIGKFLTYTDTEIIFYSYSDESSIYERIPRNPYTKLI